VPLQVNEPYDSLVVEGGDARMYGLLAALFTAIAKLFFADGTVSI